MDAGTTLYNSRLTLGDLTLEELAEGIMRYIGWAPEEFLALQYDEMEGLTELMLFDPRKLSPLQLHQRYVEADAVSPTVGAMVRAFDARRTKETRDNPWLV